MVGNDCEKQIIHLASALTPSVYFPSLTYSKDKGGEYEIGHNSDTKLQDKAKIFLESLIAPFLWEISEGTRFACY